VKLGNREFWKGLAWMFLLVRTANARYQESRASLDSIGVYRLRTTDCGLRTLEVLGSLGKSYTHCI
jgi:hypothetical protein